MILALFLIGVSDEAMAGWSKDELRYAIRYIDSDGYREAPPQCKGYVLPNGQPFVGNLIIEAFEGVTSLGKRVIQPDSCASNAEVKKNFAEALTWLKGLGIEKLAKNVEMDESKEAIATPLGKLQAVVRRKAEEDACEAGASVGYENALALGDVVIARTYYTATCQMMCGWMYEDVPLRVGVSPSGDHYVVRGPLHLELEKKAGTLVPTAAPKEIARLDGGDQTQVIAWNADETQILARVFVRFGDQGCPGYVDASNKAFKGSLSFTILDRGVEKGGQQIQNGCECTDPKDAQDSLKKAKGEWAAAGFDLKRPGTELTADKSGRVQLPSGDTLEMRNVKLGSEVWYLPKAGSPKMLSRALYRAPKPLTAYVSPSGKALWLRAQDNLGYFQAKDGTLVQTGF